MHAALLTLILVLPGECEECKAGAKGSYAIKQSAPAAVRCPNYTPPVRWYCKPCAGCAGTKCLSCQQPYFGSAPYNYRVQFDYPWSQQPCYCGYRGPSMLMEEEIPIDAEPLELELGARRSKPKTVLKR